MSFPHPPPHPPHQPPEQISLQRAITRPFPPLIPLVPNSRQERLDAMIANLHQHHQDVKTHLLHQTLHARPHLPPPTRLPPLPDPTLQNLRSPYPHPRPSSSNPPPIPPPPVLSSPSTRAAPTYHPSTAAPPPWPNQKQSMAAVVSEAAAKLAVYERHAARTEGFYRRARERMREGDVVMGGTAGVGKAGMIDATRDPRLRR